MAETDSDEYETIDDDNQVSLIFDKADGNIHNLYKILQYQKIKVFPHTLKSIHYPYSELEMKL